MVTRIHYFFDPMCGWCYGATPLLETLEADPNIELVLHPGGMIPKRAIEAHFRNHILQADTRIAQLTGARFGEAYKARVASNKPLILDSYQTALAVMVAQQLAEKGVAMLKAIQTAHYVDGQDVTAVATLQQLAKSLGFAEHDWQLSMTENQANIVGLIHSSQALMQQFQVQGFPTLLIESARQWIKPDHSAFYQQPQAWKAYINDLISAQ